MYIKVFVTPSARKEKIEKKGDTLAIFVREPASGNHANTRVRELVALAHGVPLRTVRILTGHRGRSKIISISN